MSTQEWWEQIERHLLERNWTGVLVCADGLQEAGEERLAGTLRWVADHYDRGLWISRRGRFWKAIVAGSGFEDDSLQELIETLTHYRRTVQEFFK